MKTKAATVPVTDTQTSFAGLTVSLSAIQNNYRTLAAKVAPALCAAVVKANAYGLGIAQVGPALWTAGARHFFVALLQEGIQLRQILPEAKIYILNGVLPGEEKLCLNAGLIPVLNTPEDVKRWAGQDVALHVDTGLNRLGINHDVVSVIDFSKVTVKLILSHLACADTPGHALNALQLKRFNDIKALFPGVPTSLAASDGIFCGADFYHDMVRPGAALYGVNPTPSQNNPMQSVVTVTVPVLQVRTVSEDGTIGYGATASVKKGQRLATVSLGYADGFFRSLSNKGALFYQGIRLPVLGRVSMDVTILDLSALGNMPLNQGDLLTLFGPGQTPDSLAKDAGTIGYEVMTALGQRFSRRYHS